MIYLHSTRALLFVANTINHQFLSQGKDTFDLKRQKIKKIINEVARE